MSDSEVARAGMNATPRRGGGGVCSCPGAVRVGTNATLSHGGVGMAASDPAALLAGAGVTLSSASGMPGDIAPASGVPGGVEDVGPAVEAALTRDDALGRLMDAAFNLPPPAPPEFEE